MPYAQKPAPPSETAGLCCDSELHMLRESAGNHIALLLGCEGVEAHGIAGYANGKLRIFIGIGSRVFQHFAAHNVYVQVLAAFYFRAHIAVYDHFSVGHIAQVAQGNGLVGGEMLVLAAQAACLPGFTDWDFTMFEEKA